ncbi:hypothetical protein [Pseudomonas sp. NMS19W]|uniref:hypothetical protein n=1 Tax=Pseudomonas sp. NMS19W TaxID=3079768 RepID=UPI003F65F64D
MTRFNQAPEPFAPPFKLLVKLEIPGGQDIDPGQGHSNLHMEFRPPEIVQDGVDKDTAAKGVDIWITAKPGSGSNLPYPDIAVGDVIWVSWGPIMVPSDPVTQAQIDDPLNNPIVIHISKDVILAVGDSGRDGLAVSFFVRDFADNESEDWCKETRIIVDTGKSRLEAPIVKQANGNELDVNQLGKEQLVLQVFAASSVDYNLGDIIIMYLEGITSDGKNIRVVARQTIDKNPPLVVEVLMDNDGARALAKTQAVFFFDLERGGSIIQRSKGRFINIIGETERLAAPIVESAVSGALDPDLPNVIVRIPYDPLITPDNAIEIHWSITLPDGTLFEPELDWYFPTQQEADDPDGFFDTISGPDYLKPGEGGTLVVSYDVLSEGENGEIVRRPSPPASPLNIGEPKLELVPAILLGEKDGTFEPNSLPNGISEVTCPNPVNNPTLPKDVVHWQLYDAQGVLLFTDNKTLNSLSAGKPVKFPLNAAFVQQYFEAHRGEQLSIRYHIVRDAAGKTSYSNPLEFYIGGFTSDVTTFDNDKWNGWRAITPTDWVFVSIDTDRRARNSTQTDNSDGVVLQKKYHGMIVGKTYSFSIEHARTKSFYAVPRLSLSAGGQTIAGPVDIVQTTLQTLSGTFTASAVSVELAVVSHEASGYGNDYELSSMKVIRLS